MCSQILSWMHYLSNIKFIVCGMKNLIYKSSMNNYKENYSEWWWKMKGFKDQNHDENFRNWVSALFNGQYRRDCEKDQAHIQGIKSIRQGSKIIWEKIYLEGEASSLKANRNSLYLLKATGWVKPHQKSLNIFLLIRPQWRTFGWL